MKKSRNVIFVLLIILLVSTGFGLGRYTKKQEISKDRQLTFQQQIHSAVNKINTEDLQDPDTREAIISNIYAAYVYCDDPSLAGQLYDLWNKI